MNRTIVIPRIGGRWGITIMSAAIVVAVICCTTCSAQTVQARWPRTIDLPEGHVIMYQPQLESLEGNRLKAMAAVSITAKGTKTTVFGAVWIDARVLIDRDTRRLTCLSVEIPNVRFPNATPQRQKELAAILKSQLPKGGMALTLDQLLAMLDIVVKGKLAAENLQFNAPRIILVTHPAVLVTIEGKPKLAVVKDTRLMRVVNTPFFIVFDSKGNTYYLKAGEHWLAAPGVVGPWQEAKKVPTDAIILAATKGPGAAGSGGPPAKWDRMPQIIVATEPTELVQFEGLPKFATIRGTGLMYVTNTESDAFVDIASQRKFLLLSGRWYSATSKDGPWAYVPADKLPADFAKIPAVSEKRHVLAHVAGTLEAREAVLDAHIPQMAVVRRKGTTLAVVYDGHPSFATITGTTMAYAVNTSYAVIRANVAPTETKYYCCHQAVWYEANASTGPWTVCVSVPAQISTIPPACPVYYVKYVYVYDYTPEVVYIGYTPGYVGCHVYGGVVVYGTGYVYKPWYGTVYYARPVTWGVAVRYNPNTGGWAVRVGYGGVYGGAIIVGGGWGGGGGYWRGGGYRSPYGRPGHPANPRGRYDPRGRADPRGRYDPRGPADPRSPGARPGTPEGSRSGGRAGIPEGSRAGGPGNVMTDRKGDTYRRSMDGWQKRGSDGWSKGGKGVTDQKRRDLDSQFGARQQGSRRSGGSGRSSSGSSRRPSTSGSSRGGGSRRR